MIKIGSFLPTLLVVGLLMFPACKSGSSEIIEADSVEVKEGRLTPEILWALGRLGEACVSPSGKYVAYNVRYFSVKANKGNTDIYIMKIDGSEVKRLTSTAESEGNLVWGPKDELLYFLKGGQIYQMDPMVKRPKARVVSVEREAIDGFKFSPDFSQVAYIKQVQVKPYVSDLYPDLPQSSGMVFNDMNYRHWDEWVFTAPHLFIASVQKGKMSSGKDILEGEAYEAPVKPFGGCEQFDWHPDGKKLVYTSRKLMGLAYALSTNTDLYLYDLTSSQTVNLTQGMVGYDMNPVFSPSGQYLAWESMERDGYEADKIRLVVMDISTGRKVDVSCALDQNVGGLTWNKTSQRIYFVSDYHAVEQIYEVQIDSVWNREQQNSEVKLSKDGLQCIPAPIRCLTEGVHNYTSVMSVNEHLLLGLRMSMSKPSEIISVQLKENAPAQQKQISQINTPLLDKLKMGKVQERWINTTDGKKMLTWVIFPPDFDSTLSYPTLLYCEGGPQSTVSQFWSFRWNFQIMAANGYIVVAPNRRGLPGFGQEWLEQISGDYGGQNMKDYLCAIDELSKEPYVDKNRLGCVGASYGGFSVYWLAGHHHKRFKGFIAHDGMFNLEQQYLETEELWFTNWDLGGAYWDKSPVAQKTYANSPHLFVDQWDSPILIVHGEKDFRIVASQGMSAFNAAIMRGLTAELLIFPDENHWVLSPQNGVLWQRRFFRFLDKHVKGLSQEELQSCHHKVDKTSVIEEKQVAQ